MTFEFAYDSCDCILEFSDNSLSNVQSNLSRAVRKCKLHQNIPDAAIAAVVLAHNRGFNSLFGSVNLTPAQEQVITTNKAAERERIRNLP